MRYPKISIIIVTLNNQRTLEKCLSYIHQQTYPKDKIEYINIDGGSSDRTREILKKNNFKSYLSPVKRNAEAQRAIGLRKARNNLIVSIDADNYLIDKNWIKKMIIPFVENKKLVHANTIHFEYDPRTTAFNRYCALFGVLDPIVYYIGRPDRLPFTKSKWKLGKSIKKKKGYYIMTHTLETLPTVGCNGVVYRRDILLKYAKSSTRDFLHIDVFADLVEEGFRQFAVVEVDVFHDTAVNLHSLLKKRILFLKHYFLTSKVNRRYLIYDASKISDNIKLFLYILFTITLVKPLADSIKGYTKIKDTAWFLHPVICYVYLFSYAYVTFLRITKIR